MNLPRDLLKAISRFCEPRDLVNFALVSKETHELLFPVLQWRRKISSKNYCAKLYAEPAETDITFLKKEHYWHLDCYAFSCPKVNRGDIYKELTGDLLCYDGRNGMYRMFPILSNPSLKDYYLPPQIQVSRDEFTPDYWRNITSKGFDPDLIWFSDDLVRELYDGLRLSHIPEKTAPVWVMKLQLDREWTVIYGEGDLPSFEEFRKHPWHLSKPFDRKNYYVTEYLDRGPTMVEGYIFWVPMLISV